MAKGELSGSQRAAILLLGVGEDAAASIMRLMEPKEVQRVGEAMGSLNNVSNDQIESVLSEFHEQIDGINPLSIGVGEFTQRVMTQALGENKARTMLAKILPGAEPNRGIDALRWMDAQSVAELIAEEHPQIIAIVLSSLDAEHASQVLAQLPDDVRTDAVLRVARLEVIDPAAMEELDRVLERQLGKSKKTPPRSVQGMNNAAALMNGLDAELEASIMASLKEQDEALATKVGELMFVFEDLMSLDDRGMQRLIRDIAVDNLVVALKGVDESIQEKFFDNMSSRAADMLREDLEAKGPVKLAEVEAAQKDILSVAKQLSDEGELMLGKGADDFV